MLTVGTESLLESSQKRFGWALGIQVPLIRCPNLVLNTAPVDGILARVIAGSTATSASKGNLLSFRALLITKSIAERQR